MEIELLIKSIIGLVVLLGILMTLLFFPSKKGKVVKQKEVKKPIVKIDTDIESLRDIIKRKKTNADVLQKTLDLIIKHHGNIHEKLGTRAHPDFDIYHNILFTICRHPNANKDMIVKFDRELVARNENYKKDINEAITMGLNSRRV